MLEAAASGLQPSSRLSLLASRLSPMRLRAPLRAPQGAFVRGPLQGRAFASYHGQNVKSEQLLKKNDEWLIEETNFCLGRVVASSCCCCLSCCRCCFCFWGAAGHSKESPCFHELLLKQPCSVVAVASPTAAAPISSLLLLLLPLLLLLLLWLLLPSLQPVRFKETDDFAHRVIHLMDAQLGKMHTRLRDGTCVPVMGLYIPCITDKPTPLHQCLETPLLKYTWDETYTEAYDN